MHNNKRPLIAVLAMAAISLNSYGQMAIDKCKFLGNIIGASVPGDFGEYWNQVTPENGGKWGSIERTRDVMSWEGLDRAYHYAKENGLPFKQHTLVWGQQQPAWISTLSAAEQKAEVEEWIQAFCSRYPETDYIDVVNEPLHAAAGYSPALGGAGSTGWDWVVWSFEKARQYCPNARLALNDYNILSNDEATLQYVAIINVLKERNLIDIVGEQGHFLETTPSETISRNLGKLAATGLPIHISEYDVNLADDQAQLEVYQEQFPVLWNHPAVHGITLWGYREGEIWRENAYLTRTNGSARPALTWLADFVASSDGGLRCDPVTGMREQHDEMELYPSPAPGGRFTLNLGEGNFTVRILNTHGDIRKELKVSRDGPVPVHLRDCAGLYLVHIYDGQQITCRKIIVD